MSPAYDNTFAFNPLINFKKQNRALSINSKRNNITVSDILKIAEDFTIKNPKGIIKEIQSYTTTLLKYLDQFEVPKNIAESIKRNFIRLL